jgi:hypothetical protein
MFVQSILVSESEAQTRKDFKTGWEPNVKQLVRDAKEEIERRTIPATVVKEIKKGPASVRSKTTKRSQSKKKQS